MATWHPGGLSWEQYLQANSFVGDIKGQLAQSTQSLETKISEQTLEIVASNAELSRAFGDGFDSINNTLRGGFKDVEFAIDKLNADFNYSMGLLIEQYQIQNKLFEDLLDKLDAIHKTLESPLLTQARELYRIGCERANKKLLDKALVAFLDAEKKNDTDFFIQYHIGMLYLYGLDEDDNVVDLKKAKAHLLQAARYAKAEISVDPTFSHYAAESLLHASIANYARLDEFYEQGDQNKIEELLAESKDFAKEAVDLYPQLLEARYHLAKYETLLSEIPDAVTDLQTVIEHDRNYALKAQDDSVFDEIRANVFKMLNGLKEKAKSRFSDRLEKANQIFNRLAAWHPEQSDSLLADYQECKKILNIAKEYSNADTYFGYLDANRQADTVIENSKRLIDRRITEFSERIKNIIKSCEDKFVWEGESGESDQAIQESKNLIEKAKQWLNETSYESYDKALDSALVAYDKASFAEQHAQKVKRNREIEVAERTRQERLTQQKIETAGKTGWVGAKIGACVGGLGGCYQTFNQGYSHIDFSYFFGGIFGGVVVGFVIGYTLGYLSVKS